VREITQRAASPVNHAMPASSTPINQPTTFYAKHTNSTSAIRRALAVKRPTTSCKTAWIADMSKCCRSVICSTANKESGAWA